VIIGMLGGIVCLIDRTTGFSVGEDSQARDLDIAEHGEAAYHLN